MSLISQKELLDQLMLWSSINTYSYHLEGLEKQLHLIEAAFGKLADKVEIFNLAPQLKLSKKGEITKTPLGKAIKFQKRSSAKRQVFFSGHYDTVFPPSSPFQNPILKGEHLSGPGVLDMKGGLLILLSALKAFESSTSKNDLGWTLLISPDEEIGSPGSSQLIKDIAPLSDVGIALEPCLPNGNLISNRKGSLNFEIHAKGTASHAGREFEKGKSAIYALTPFINWCAKNPVDETNINLGRIEGGGALNVVPDHASIGVGVRSTKLEGFKEVEKHVNTLCGSSDFQYLELSYRPPKPFDVETQKLFSLYKSCSEQVGERLNFEGSGGVCDGNNIASCGLPTIDTVGVKGGGIHSENEYIEIESLETKAKVLFLFIEKIATMSSKELPKKRG